MKLQRSVAGLVGLLLAAAVPSGAGTMRCESDPAVLLSDGTVLDLTASIGAPLWEIESVSYTIRVPAGVQVVAVIGTPNWPTTLEHISVTADNARGRYDTVTVVETTQPTDVSARLTVKQSLSSLSSLLQAALVIEDGLSGEAIPAGVSFRR